MAQQALLSLGFLVWLLGCGKTLTTPNLDQSFKLQPGQTATVQGEGLQVTFDTVENDSRCPSDVTCVWEGDATVKVTLVQPPRAKENRELHTGLTPRKVTYGALEVEIKELQPQPRSTAPIPREGYLATFVVRRAGSASPP